MAMQKYGNDLGLHYKGIIICSCQDSLQPGEKELEYVKNKILSTQNKINLLQKQFLLLKYMSTKLHNILLIFANTFIPDDNMQQGCNN